MKKKALKTKIERKFLVKFNKKTKKWSRIKGAFWPSKAMKKMLDEKRKVSDAMGRQMLKDKKFKKLMKDYAKANNNVALYKAIKNKKKVKKFKA